MRYEQLWRNKWLTADARTLGEMIKALQAAADELREMEAGGVTLDPESDIGGDFASLITEDPAVAQKFGFDEEDLDEDEEEEEDLEHPEGPSEVAEVAAP